LTQNHVINWCMNLNEAYLKYKVLSSHNNTSKVQATLPWQKERISTQRMHLVSALVYYMQAHSEWH